MRQLTLGHSSDPRNSRQCEVAAVIRQKRRDIIFERDLQRVDNIREIFPECFYYGHKISSCFSGSAPFSYGIERKLIVEGHISTVKAILDTLYKYYHMSNILFITAKIMILIVISDKFDEKTR